MSQPMRSRTPLDMARTLPDGDVVGQYRNYLDAQKAVDYLADQQFPVQGVSIVGNDLHMVERVTARLSYPRVALSGASQGLMLGFFVGLVFALFGPSPNYLLLLPTMAIGAAVFMVISVIQYSLTRGRRDFASVNTIVARSYDVVVEREVAGQARQLLQKLPMHPGAGAVAQNPAQQAGMHQHGAPQQGAPPQQGTQQGTQQQGVPPFGALPQDGTADNPVKTPENWPSGWREGDKEDANKPENSAAPASPVSSQRFPDLPDGRPQFGVRVDPKDAPQKENDESR